MCGIRTPCVHHESYNKAKAKVLYDILRKGGDRQMTNIATAADLMKLSSSVLDTPALVETCQLCSWTM